MNMIGFTPTTNNEICDFFFFLVVIGDTTILKACVIKFYNIPNITESTFFTLFDFFFFYDIKECVTKSDHISGCKIL